MCVSTFVRRTTLTELDADLNTPIELVSMTVKSEFFHFFFAFKHTSIFDKLMYRIFVLGFEYQFSTHDRPSASWFGAKKYCFLISGFGLL